MQPLPVLENESFLNAQRAGGSPYANAITRLILVPPGAPLHDLRLAPTDHTSMESMASGTHPAKRKPDDIPARSPHKPSNLMRTQQPLQAGQGLVNPLREGNSITFAFTHLRCSFTCGSERLETSCHVKAIFSQLGKLTSPRFALKMANCDRSTDQAEIPEEGLLSHRNRLSAVGPHCAS